MKLKLASLGLVALLLGLIVSAPLSAQAAAPTAQATPGVSTVLPTTTLPDGTIVNSVLNVTQFANQGGTLNALGTVTSTLTNPLTGATQTVTQNVAVPVTAANASCSILSLTLGPIHLNLLGLVVDLNQVNLNITAVPGAGNLLGNLLCAVANLLNGGGPLSSITGLLNNILRVLGTL